MTSTDTQAIAEAYAERRENDWNAFVNASGLGGTVLRLARPDRVPAARRARGRRHVGEP